MEFSGRSCGSFGAVCAAELSGAAGPDDVEDAPRETLRGLNNLGNTCFMNCVLQMLLHVPALRAFFLGGGHECGSECCRGDPCLACEVAMLFAEMADSKTSPFSPANLLMSWWSFADDLSGYRQQDAHEFYLSLLSGLHELGIAVGGPAVACGKAAPRPPPPLAGSRCGTPEITAPRPSPPLLARAALSDADMQVQPGNGRAEGDACSSPTPPPRSPLVPALHGNSTADAAPPAGCGSDGAAGAACAGAQAEPRDLKLVDGVFGGLLHSEVTCLTCGTTSVAADPFLDISLDIVRPTAGGGRGGGGTGTAGGPRRGGARQVVSGAAGTASERDSGSGGKGGTAAARMQHPVGSSADAAADTAAALHCRDSGPEARSGRGGGAVGVSVLANLKRTERCGACHTCLNRYLKKRCLRPHAPAPSSSQPPHLASTGSEDAAGGGSSSGAGRSSVDGAASEDKPSTAGNKCRDIDVDSGAGGEASASAGPAHTPDAASALTAATARASNNGLSTLRAAADAANGACEADAARAAADEPPPSPSPSPPLLKVPSLQRSLARFVQPEQLPAGGSWVCESCRSPQAAVKQLSIRRLPLVLTLHIKRFEHGDAGGAHSSYGHGAAPSAGVTRKLQSSLDFPLADLDMGPFTTTALLRQRIGSRAATAEALAASACAGDDDGCHFELLGCVCHIGDMSGGHYIAYVKFDGSWFCCNDALVTHADEAAVRGCQPYMLFYSAYQAAALPQ